MSARRRPEPQSLDVVGRRLLTYADVSDDDLALLGRATAHAATFPARAELIREGHELRPLFVVEGWACRQRVLPDGRRQIVALYLPGDLIGSVLDRPPRYSPCTFLALTPVTASDGSSVRAAISQEPDRHGRLAHAFARAEFALVEHLVNHVVRLGQQTALERMAHFFLEIEERLRDVGLVADDGFSMPLTQETLADTLGVSHVHINRTLQTLRRDELVSVKGPAVVLRDVEALHRIADYRPDAAARD